MNRTIFILFVLIAGSLDSGICLPEEIRTIAVQTEEWKDCTEKKGSGLYFDLIREIYEPLGIRMKYEIVPYKRSIASVTHSKVDMAVGAYPSEVKDVIYPKWHFFVDDVSVVFMKKNHAGWHGEESLRDKRLGWLLGYSYNKYIKVPLKSVFETSKQKTAFDMLTNDRLDYFVGPAIMIEPELDRNRFEMKFLKWIKMYTVFQNSTRGALLSKIWDSRFEKLFKAGRIKELFTRYDMMKYYQYEDATP